MALCDGESAAIPAARARAVPTCRAHPAEPERVGDLLAHHAAIGFSTWLQNVRVHLRDDEKCEPLPMTRNHSADSRCACAPGGTKQGHPQSAATAVLCAGRDDSGRRTLPRSDSFR